MCWEEALYSGPLAFKAFLGNSGWCARLPHNTLQTRDLLLKYLEMPRIVLSKNYTLLYKIRTKAWGNPMHLPYLLQYKKDIKENP